ncbi:MAG: ABC transporter transmembrane domain-containing protein, partial [Anaerolineales bacterium]
MTVAEFVLPHTLRSDRRSPGRWILSHVARHGWIVLMMVVGAISNAALAGVVPIFVGRAFNLILADPGALPELAAIAVWIVVSQVVRSALQMGRNFGAELIGQRLERDIRDELYASLLGKSMTFHSLQPVGDTMARATNDVREVNLMFNPGLNLVVGSAIFLVIPALYAPAYHPALAIIPTLFIAAYGFALWQYLAELRPITDRARQAFGTMNAHLAEALDGVEVVKGAAQEAEEVGRFSANARAHRDAFVHQGNVEARFLPFLLMVLAQAAGLAHALILFGQGALDVGGVVAYMGLLFLFGFPTFVSLFAYSQVSLGMASARRILELITRSTELDRNRGGHT